MSSYGVKLTKAHYLYRNSRVGIAMFDAIHELLEANLLNPQQALIIVTQFDFSIRRIMATKYSEQNLFSFEAEVKTYRLQPDWSVVLLENVAFYQHFPSKRIQLYKNQKDEVSSSAKRISDKKYKEFLKKATTNDVRVLIESVPNMLLIGKSCLTISATGSCNDPDLGNCKLVEEQRKFVHPRLSLFRLSHREIRKADFSEKEPVVDENILPVPVLNRFRNSTFWSTPTAPLEAEQYYSRKLTLDPNYRKRYSYEHTFDKSRDCQNTQSVRRLKEFSSKNQTLSNQVDTLEKNLKSREKDLESKDEEIKMLKARLERKGDS